MVSGTVLELWRYPVKSLLGERCEHVWLDQRGVIGDRLYAVRDEAGKFGSGKTTVCVQGRVGIGDSHHHGRLLTPAAS